MLQALNCLMDDIGRLHNISVAGDVMFLTRLNQEGKLLGFLSVWHSALLASIEHKSCESLASLSIEGFGIRDQGSARNFLFSLRILVFDRSSHRELLCPDELAFKSLYQVGCFLSKFGAGRITPKMGEEAINAYLDIEEFLGLDSDFLQVASEIALARSILDEFFNRFSPTEVPEGRHGPGAVAEGSLPSGQKYNWSLPMDVTEDLYPGCRQYLSIAHPRSRRTGIEPFTSRVCLVPKSWNKCRIICAEPAFMQYNQQGLDRWMRRTIDVARKRKFFQLDLTDQSQNADIALESSTHGYFCTMDLSSASDRLSNKLVRCLMPDHVYVLLERVRSKWTRLPDGREIELRKFASMGNATTFPVQSLCFWALSVAAMHIRGVRLEEARNSVWVYGDDIICPTKYYSAIFDTLTLVGLKVNKDKSFSKGEFRESCGMHAYHGLDVTPSFLRTMPCNGPASVSVCATANLLSRNGYSKVADFLFQEVESCIHTRLPYTLKASQLTRVLDDRYHTFMDCVDANLKVGIRLYMDGYQYLSVKAWGLYENPAKRTINRFSDIGDMWSYITTSPRSEYDRGQIPGAVQLSQRLVRLR